MRTIPEIVAQMKELIAELEQHTGLPPKKESYSDSGDYYGDVITNISLYGQGGPTVSLSDLPQGNMAWTPASATDCITISDTTYTFPKGT
jgi:hypothetical protein